MSKAFLIGAEQTLQERGPTPRRRDDEDGRLHRLTCEPRKEYTVERAPEKDHHQKGEKKGAKEKDISPAP